MISIEGSAPSVQEASFPRRGWSKSLFYGALKSPYKSIYNIQWEILSYSWFICILRHTMNTLYYLRSLITYFTLEVVPLEALLHRGGEHVFEAFWPTHLNFLHSTPTVNNILLAKYYSWANLNFSSSSIVHIFAWTCWLLKCTEISDHHYQSPQVVCGIYFFVVFATHTFEFMEF